MAGRIGRSGAKKLTIAAGAILFATLIPSSFAAGSFSAPAPVTATASAASSAAVSVVVVATVVATNGIGATTTAPADSSSINAAPGIAIVGTAPIRQAPAPVAAQYQASTPQIVENVPYTSPVDCGSGSLCQWNLDIYVPTGPGPYPSVVLVRGGPYGADGRQYLDSFAQSLASQGLLVFNIDIRDLASQGGGYPQAMQDVACGIRYARAVATTYGGDGGPVTLVGHSFGAYVASLVALNPVEYQGGCLYGGSGRPDAFVGLAGCYDVLNGGNAGDFASYFGGTADETAAVRAAANPFAYATGSTIPVTLVAGTADETVDPVASSDLAAFLAGRGWNATLESVPDASHMSILDSAGQEAVMDTVGLSQAAANALDQVSGVSGS